MFVPSGSGRVLVIGDIILDRYVQGETLRISPEAPVPVVKVYKTEERPGGAANVAVNISSLGVGVTLFGIIGEDGPADRLAAMLDEYHIPCHLIRQRGFSTIIKQRVISRHQQLLRLDFEENPPQAGLGELDQLFADRISDFDTIVFSDYGKGTLDSIVRFIDMAKENGIRVFVDPKGMDFSRYRHADFLTPNFREFESVVGVCKDEATVLERAYALGRELQIGALCITRGEQGMTLVDIRANRDRHFAVQAREVFDVTGAGDTFIAVLAAAVSTGYSLDEALEFANLGAGIVVEKLGTAYVTAEELNYALTGGEKRAGKVVSRPELLNLVAEARNRGERVVMTNGCFDILHAGHVNYLQQAKSLGDRLIIAVNDDDSVRRLKGAGRPVNSLDERMEVLMGLAAVDWIIPFSEDTPAQLIEAITPDILVKGGDYRQEEVAGAQAVTRNGGTVRIIPYRQGNSTSALIQSIRGAGK